MYDLIIMGCGVIGASIAYKLSRYHLKVLVLERENDVAMGTTKANSGIVHAGYDPLPGTLMAQLNIRGAEQMETLCRDLDVPYKRTGSLVLGFSDGDQDTLKALYKRGEQNGVAGLRLLSPEEIHGLEPNLSEDVTGGLFAPTAAVVDPWGLCLAMAETAVKNGVKIQCSSCVTGIRPQENSIRVITETGEYEGKYALNCTGGHGHEISAMLGTPEWKPMPSRGEYYLLDKSSGSLVNRVIFQCPGPAGKGVLVSPTVHGNLIIGPNAESVADIDDLATTSAGLDKVARESRRSVPDVDLRQSIRTFSGVRANTSESDFIIRPCAYTHRLIHVAGIKSPGLSSAPAVADYVIELLKKSELSWEKKQDWNGSRKQIRFRELSQPEKQKLVAENPAYGRVICRCETVTEGEILAAIHSPVPPCSVDGIKRRTGAGMGRCQGGFCGPRIVDILAKELGCDPMDVLKDGENTKILMGCTKGAHRS